MSGVGPCLRGGCCRKGDKPGKLTGTTDAICWSAAGTVIGMMQSGACAHTSAFHSQLQNQRSVPQVALHTAHYRLTQHSGIVHVCKEHTWLMGTGESRELEGGKALLTEQDVLLSYQLDCSSGPGGGRVSRLLCQGEF